MSKYGEPWTQSALPREAVTSAGSRVFAHDPDVTSRAVACVNALAGLNPEAVRALIDAARAVIDHHHGDGRSDDGACSALRRALMALEDKP